MQQNQARECLTGMWGKLGAAAARLMQDMMQALHQQLLRW
jgi:hypothetical protein